MSIIVFCHNLDIMNFNEEINAAVKTSSLIHINDANKIYIEEHQQIPMKGYDDKWIII